MTKMTTTANASKASKTNDNNNLSAESKAAIVAALAKQDERNGRGNGKAAVKLTAGKGKGKGKEKTAKVEKSAIVARKLLYRAFYDDKEAVSLNGGFGGLCIANLRGGFMAQMDHGEKGNDCVIIEGEQGIGAIRGKLVTLEGKKGIQAGTFWLQLDGQKVLFQGQFSALGDYVKKHGKKQAGERKAHKGGLSAWKFAHILGTVGKEYLLACDGKGNVGNIQENLSGWCNYTLA